MYIGLHALQLHLVNLKYLWYRESAFLSFMTFAKMNKWVLKRKFFYDCNSLFLSREDKASLSVRDVRDNTIK